MSLSLFALSEQSVAEVRRPPSPYLPHPSRVLKPKAEPGPLSETR